MKIVFKGFMILLLALVLTSAGFAQGRQTGSIHGSILDEEGFALPGATVTLSGPAMMGTKSYVSSETGKFRFVALPPGEYEVKAELPGFKTYIRKGLRASVGKTTEVTITLEMTVMEEEVTVTAENPTIDIQSSKISVHYDTDFLLAIPHARDLYGIQQSLPGAIEAESGREYTRMSSILGGTLRSTLYQLDGAIMNDPTTTYIAANVNVDVYEEIEIGIGSLPAEVGMTDTAVINIVTKSGGNKFSGMISGYYTGKELAEDLWSEEQMEALNVVAPQKYTEYLDGSLSVGGPIIKDRLWFFLNGRRLTWERELPYTSHLRIQKIYDTNPDAFHPNDLKPYDLEHQDTMAFAKLTFQLTKNLRYMGMLHYNMVNEPIYSLRVGNNRAWGYTAAVDHEKVYTTSHQFNWILDQNTFVDIRANYVNRHYPNMMRPEAANNYTTYDRKESVWWGNTSLSDDYYRKRYGASATITRFQDDFLGASHELKAGVDWEDTYYIRDRCRGYELGDNPYYTYWRDFAAGNKYYESTTASRGRLYIRPYMHLGAMIGEDNTRRYSAFVQDAIVTGKLAINIGFRLDHSYLYEPEQHRPDVINYKVGPEFLNPAITDPNLLLRALNDQYHNDPNVKYNQVSALDEFTFPYKKVVEFTTLSPRIGFIYDLFGDGKTAIKASFSRYFEPIWSGKYNAPQPFGSTLRWDWNDLNANGYMDLPSTGPDDPQYIDPTGDSYLLKSYRNQDPNIQYYYEDLKCPYMHEFIVGVEHELMKDFRLGFQFIYKQNKNLTEDIDPTNGYDPNATDDQGRPIWLPYTVTDPGWDAEFGTGDDQQLTVYGLADYAPTQSYRGTNPPEAKREYTAGVLTFDKRMSGNWQLKGSIIYSSFRGNCAPDYGATEGESGMFDNPNTLINNYGSVRFDYPLQIKLIGTVMLPYNFTITAYFQHRSGSPWARTLDRVYFPPEGDPQWIDTQWTYTSGVFTETRGTRRGPTLTLLDMRLEKSFSFGDYGKLSFYVDIFNALARRTLSVERNPYARLKFYKDPPEYKLNSSYGRINSVSGVRSFRLGFRWSF